MVTQLLFPIAVVVVLWYLMWRLRRPTKHREEFEPRMWGKRELAREESALSDKEDQLEILLHERSRAVLAQIDTKLALLQELISRAESAAARLERALATQTVDGAWATQTRANGVFSERPESLAGEGTASSARRHKTAADPDFADASPESVSEEVRSLATYGFSPAEISQQLGISEDVIRNKLAK
ncbi:MAG: hypothetical protein ACUVQK_03465 [Thermogutta sp.]